jgi:ATP-binding cassette subfamily B protein
MIISAPIRFIGGIALSLEQDVALSGVIAVTLPIIAIVAAFFLKKMTPYFKVFQKKLDRMNEVLREQISGVRVVRAFVRENTEKKRFDKANTSLYDLNIKTGRLMTMLFPIFMMIVNFSIIAIMWFGGIRIDNGDMEIGAITAFITYMMYIMMAVLMSAMVFAFLPRAEVASKRINEVLKTKSSIVNTKTPRRISTPLGVVEFKNVEFRYAGASEPVLRDISFKATPGKVTAIIGSTGCGKSTLLRLIPRLFDATGGDIYFDGINLRDLDLDELNSYISVVPQKSFLFGGTVKENLLFGKADASDEELWSALEIAQAAAFIKEKAEKANIENPLELEVSQGGTNFSGGQRQRLAIARAVVRKPYVYQFDDSFSALDYKTDHDLRQKLYATTGNATVIVVAQRVGTIRHADQILVMDEGQIVGTGTHEELLKSCQTYQEIVNSQLTAEEALK